MKGSTFPMKGKLRQSGCDSKAWWRFFRRVAMGRSACAFEDRGMPPFGYFLISAVFHYLGPAFAVLLFARVDALGVALLRIGSAALVFALWRRPWRVWRRCGPATRRLGIA